MASGVAANRLEDILCRAQMLNDEIRNSNDIPKVNRSIDQILTSSKSISERISRIFTSNSSNSDSTANFLLGSISVNFDQNRKNLEQITKNQSLNVTTNQNVHNNDVDNYLKNEREKMINHLMEDCIRKSLEESTSNIDYKISKMWQNKKKSFLTQLECRNMDTFVHERPINIKSQSNNFLLTETECLYYNQVKLYLNDSTKKSNNEKLFSYFQTIIDKFDDKILKDVWHILISHCNNLHCSNDYKSRCSSDFQLAIADIGRSILEKRFELLIEDLFRLKNPSFSSHNSSFTVDLLVLLKFFYSKKHFEPIFFEDGSYESIPIWAAIYFFLRCGRLDHLKKCLEYLVPLHDGMKKNILNYVQSPTRSLNTNVEKSLANQYHQSIINCGDPFKKFIFCLLSNCDLNNSHSVVLVKTEDYYWLKLCQCLSTSCRISEKITLNQLQHLTLIKYGEQYFKAQQQPFVYVLLLFLINLPEQAIFFLFKMDYLKTHAIHLALCLIDCGLISITFDDDPLILKPQNHQDNLLCSLNFYHLIKSYSLVMEHKLSFHVVDYFILLKKISNLPNHVSKMTDELLADFIVRKHDYDNLIGSISNDGNFRAGYLSNFNIDHRNICLISAKTLVEKGYDEYALELYQLANDTSKSVPIILNKLAGVVSLPPNHSNRLYLLEKSSILVEKITKLNVSNNSDQPTINLFLLMDLAYFFDLYYKENYNEALEVIYKLDVLPSNNNTMEACLLNFDKILNEIKYVIADVLITCMSIILKLFNDHKQKTSFNHNISFSNLSDMHLLAYKEKSGSLISFVGFIPYKFSSEVTTRLLQMDSLMCL